MGKTFFSLITSVETAAPAGSNCQVFNSRFPVSSPSDLVCRLVAPSTVARNWGGQTVGLLLGVLAHLHCLPVERVGDIDGSAGSEGHRVGLVGVFRVAGGDGHFRTLKLDHSDDGSVPYCFYVLGRDVCNMRGCRVCVCLPLTVGLKDLVQSIQDMVLQPEPEDELSVTDIFRLSQAPSTCQLLVQLDGVVVSVVAQEGGAQAVVHPVQGGHRRPPGARGVQDKWLLPTSGWSGQTQWQPAAGAGRCQKPGGELSSESILHIWLEGG